MNVSACLRAADCDDGKGSMENLAVAAAIAIEKEETVKAAWASALAKLTADQAAIKQMFITTMAVMFAVIAIAISCVVASVLK